MILFSSGSDLDQRLREVLSDKYEKIIIFDQKYDDRLINDFYLSILSLKLTRNIAKTAEIDLADMQELPDNDRLYLFDQSVK